MSTYESVVAAASALPVDQRAQLIDALWTSSKPPLSQSWRDEIRRRSKEIDAGSVETIPWELIRGEALRRLGSQDAD